MGKARWRLPWQAWPAYQSLKSLIQRERIGLVHANCYPANKLAAPAAKSLGLPCLWHKQIAVKQKPESTTGRLWRYFSRYNDVVLAVSQQGWQGLKALGIPEAKLRLLYNNADTERLAKAKPISDKELRKFDIPSKIPLVLAAGMRRPHKGFDVYLKSIRSIRSKAHFVLMGDMAKSEPSHEAALRRLAEAPGLKERLSVLPAQPDLAPWFKRASLFVSPSRWEGSPLVVIEAMAAACAIVATKSGSAEILRDGKDAWLCESDDSDGLASAIDSALKSSAERAKRGRAAQAVARKRFSLNSYAKNLMSLYDSML
jgi:glycosyltransferase involved in cell wall biosynthesis